MRRALVTLHTYLGLTLGFVWAVQGLTGALLTFHRDLERIGDARSTLPMAPISRLVQAASEGAAHSVKRIGAVGRDLGVLEARYDNNGREYGLRLYAATGEIIDTRERYPRSPFSGSAWRWVYTVHVYLLAGERGRTLLGVSGVFLIVSLLAGLRFAWPRRGQWRAVFRWRKWRSGSPRLYGWHRAIGLVIAIPVLWTALAGVYMVLGPKIAPSLDPELVPIASGSVGSASGPNITPDEALAIAKEEFPTGRFVYLALPTENPGYYVVRLTLPREWREWTGRARVVIDAASGAKVAVYDPSTAPLLNRSYDVAYPIHVGEAAGLLGRCLTLLAGLALPTLYVTAIALWLKTRSGR